MSGRPTDIVCRSSQSSQARIGSRRAEIFEDYLVVGSVFTTCQLTGSVDSRHRCRFTTYQLTGGVDCVNL